MPISSGANGWPQGYFSKPPPKVAPPPVKQAPPVIISPPPPVSPQPPPPRPPPSHTRSPSPRPQYPHDRDYDRSRDRYRDHYDGGEDGGCCGGGGRGRYPDDGGCCGPQSYYTTGMAGAGAGCCMGGMFGSRAAKYPYDDDYHYAMQGTGKRRCCACVLATIFGLLLLGLILGLLLGWLPARNRNNAQTLVNQNFPGGYYMDGVYYFPMTNPPDTFYAVLGDWPCNEFNNNSDIVFPTSGYDTYTDTVSGPATTGLEQFTGDFITAPTVHTVPDCQDLTTSIVLAINFTKEPDPLVTLVMVTAGSESNIRLRFDVTGTILLLTIFILGQTKLYK